MTLTVHCDHVGQAVNRTTKNIFSLFISVTVCLSFLTLTGMVTIHCCCIDNTCIKTTNPIIPGQMFAFQQQYVVFATLEPPTFKRVQFAVVVTF